MLNKLYKATSVATVAAIALTTAVAPIFAANDPGVDALIISAPTGDWLEVAPGATHEYQIAYDAVEDSNGTLISEVAIEVEMGHRGDVSFEIYTATQLAEIASGSDVDPIGRGNLKSAETGNSNHDTKLIWASRAPISEAYTIFVTNEQNAVTSYYEIDIDGYGITYPNNVVEPAPAAPAIAAAQPVVAAEAVAMAENVVAVEAVEVIEAEPMMATTMMTKESAGYGPDSAITISNSSDMLQPGETRWYSFKYDYDNSSNSQAKDAIVSLNMTVDESLAFEIWTPNEVQLWTQNRDFNPVGAGSVFEDFDNMLQWVGSAAASNTYYVLVENVTDAPASYTLSITGATVSF